MTYDWKRFWVPRSGASSFDSDGFLLPPAHSGFTMWYSKTDAVTFSEMNEKPCLVLLGEPGIGKSFALRDAQQIFENTKKRSGARFLFLNLGSYSSDNLLVSDIFGSDEFNWWKGGDRQLHIFLDSFDECLFRIDSLAALLADRFKKLEHTRGLFLRIASRPAEWRPSLEDVFRESWGEKSVAVYELAPLTRDQVFSAATAQAIDATKFLNAVTANEVVPFAIKPLTLDLLFRIWRKLGEILPPTQREIYEQGCIELCTESAERQTPKLRRKFTPEDRLAIASQIAAATIFCRRHTIITGPQPHISETDIELSELAEGSVKVKNRELSITEIALRDALDTGLFTARGRDRMGWAHQTYAEFLAARYLQVKGLTARQVLDLVTHAQDKDRKLVPQLQEATAWIAGSNREVFDHLMKIQPEILLRSDVATADTETKALVIDSLLAYVGKEFIQSDWWQMRDRYANLKHGDVAKQLRRYLEDSSLPEDTRLEAIHIAGKCVLRELSNKLIDIALDSREAHIIREFAGIYAGQMADEATKAKLKPLALGLCGISQKAWEKWCPVILKFHFYDELAAHRLLTEKLFDRAPQEALNWLIQIVDHENREGETLWVLQKLPGEDWNGPLGDTILRRLDRGKLRPSCINALLVALLDHRVKGALEFARKLIPSRVPRSNDRYQSALLTSRLLILRGEPADWQKIKRIVVGAPEFGRGLFEGLPHDFHRVPWGVLKGLSAQEIAELWEWMLAQYPSDSDPDMTRGGFVDTRKSMARLRDNLVSLLVEMGTEAACEAIERLIKKYPAEDLRWRLSQARERTRRFTWQPPSPNQLFSLAENKSRRLVQSADQLMQVVVDALARFQEKLQGKTPLAHLLWADGRPKHEKDLSDWLEDSLNNDLNGHGIIVGREVQIHRVNRLDLRIDAVAQQDGQLGFDNVQVMIEVKGCWNKDLATAMEKQLVGRYLAKSDCQHGLYLVGWFLCDAWTNGNPSRKQVKFSSKSEMDTFLAGQSKALSIDGRRVVSVILDITTQPARKKVPRTKSRRRR